MSILYKAPVNINLRLISYIAANLPFTDAGDQRYLCFLLSCKRMSKLLDYNTEHFKLRLMQHELRQRPSILTLNPKEKVLYSVDRIYCTFFLHASDLPNYYKSSEHWCPSPYELIPGINQPEVLFAANFTNWKPIETYYIEPDLMSRYDQYHGTSCDLWPAFGVNFILPPGEFQYKFIVNGVWTNTKQAPLIFDHSNNLNNYLDTTRHRWEKSSIDQETKYKQWNLISTESTFFNRHYYSFDKDYYDKKYCWLPYE